MQVLVASHALTLASEPWRTSASLGARKQGSEYIRHGQHLHVAYGGAAALEAYDAFEPEIAFIDIAMPGMDGYEVARRLRTGASRRPLLIALTGYGQEEDRNRALEAGFDHHMVKPATIQALREILAAVPLRRMG